MTSFRWITPAVAAHMFTCAALFAWIIGSLLLPSYVLPSPLAVGARLIELVTRADYLRHGFYSLLHATLSLIFAFLIGLALATAAHYVKPLRLMIHGRINRFMNSFSALGWTFLAIIWFGANDFTVVFAMTAVLLPIVIINLREGFMQIDQDIIEMAKSFGHFRIRQYTMIALPLMTPYLAATLRIIFGVSWIISLTVELFAGTVGYGYILNRARMEFRLDLIFAIIFLIVFIVYMTERFVWIPFQDRMRKQYAGA